MDTGNFLKDYDDWNSKKVQHSSDPRSSYFAAIDAYKQNHETIQHQSFDSRDAYRAAISQYETDHLEHHGILGQKWGVRRYQNPDGTLTEAGKKRARKDAEAENEWATGKHQPSSVKASYRAGKYAANPSARNARKLDEANDADAVRYKAAKEAYAEKKKYEPLDKVDFLKTSDPTKVSDREKDAATLGMKALKKMGRDPGDIDENGIEWFLYEDQTIGLGTVADLVSQGKSKSEIKSLAKLASEAPDDKYYNPGIFELADLSGSGYLDKYVDACQEVMKDKNWKNSEKMTTEDFFKPEIANRNIGYAIKDATNPEAWKQGMESYQKFLENPDKFEMPEYVKKYYKR